MIRMQIRSDQDKAMIRIKTCFVLFSLPLRRSGLSRNTRTRMTTMTTRTRRMRVMAMPAISPERREPIKPTDVKLIADLIRWWIDNNIDRLIKQSLPRSKLTNLSSEQKVGCFCRLKKICTFNDFFFF